MQIHVTPRHLQLTAAIHQAVAAQIGHLEEIAPDILAAHVVLVDASAENPDHQFTVKVHLAVPGPDVFAEQAGKDLYLALEGVTDKLAKQLRKRKTTLNGKGRHTTQRAAERRRTGSGPLPAAVRKSIQAVRRSAAQ